MQSPSTSNRLRPFRPAPFGRYTLLMPLSTGGMGEIFLARLEGAEGFEKLCVIKKILPHLAEDKEFVTRFVGEARTLVKLTHGSIAQVLDMGLHQNEPYLALEYVDGKDLRKVGARFRERGMPLPVTFVLFVMGRVLDALAYAHRKRDDDDKEIGLVHRDVSPQNILISYEGEVKVIDFGLAKSTLNVSRTNPSIVLGKFLYMSPEQAKHGKVDRRSDLYAVGLCLYELIAGKNPFEDVPPHALMAAVATPNIAHVQTVEPLCPSNIAQIIMKALAPDPAQRFQTAEELRGKLLGCLLEIDPAAGPESCSRFMRDMFSSEYSAERKLLTQLKESARVESKPDNPAIALRPVRQSSPRLEPQQPDEMTPAPTDLRKYGGMEATAPRAKALQPAPLSFAPTPKVGGSDKPAGERETMPGILFDPTPRGPGKGQDDERVTGPHAVVFNPQLQKNMLEEDIVTRPGTTPLKAGPSLPTPLRATPQAGILGPPPGVAQPTGPEPVTSEVIIVPEPDLPSVVVGGGLQAHTVTKGPPQPQPQQPQQQRPSASRVQVSSVLVPAASVRTPEVMAPLPKALEGKHRPDENLVTDRGTRTKRTSVLVVLVPLLAVLGLAGFVALTIFKESAEELSDDAARSGSKMKSNNDDRKKKTAPGGDIEMPVGDEGPDNTEAPEPPEPEAVENPMPAAPAAAPAAGGEDALEELPVLPTATARGKKQKQPKSPAQECLTRLLSLHEKLQRVDAATATNLWVKIAPLKNQANGLPPGSQARFLEQCAELQTRIDAKLREHR